MAWVQVGVQAGVQVRVPAGCGVEELQGTSSPQTTTSMNAPAGCAPHDLHPPTPPTPSGPHTFLERRVLMTDDLPTLG